MKKFLSVVLSLVMVFGLVSVASAAVNDATMAIRVEPTATSYAKGDVVTFNVVYETTSELGALGVAVNMHIGYDSDVFEPVDAALTGPGVVLGFGSSETVVVAGYPVEDNCEASLSDVQLKTGVLNSNDTAKGWDTVLQIAMAETTASYDDYSSGAASFAFKLKIKDTAPDDGSYVVGITDYSIVNEITTINEEVSPLFGLGEGWGFSASKIFEVVDGVAAVASAYDLFHVENQWRPNGDAYDIGVKFGFKTEDIKIAFDEIGTSTNVTAVGADIYVDGVKVDGIFESQYVYDVNGDDSEYQYRVIIKNLAKADATEYTVKPYVVIDGNTVYGEEATVSAAAIVPQA